MSAQSDGIIGVFEIIINFLDKNIIYLLIMFLAYLFRNPLSDFIKRLENLTFKNSESEVGLTASPVRIEKIPVSESDDRSGNLVTEEKLAVITIEENEDKKSWYAALEEGNVEAAKALFKEFESQEKDNSSFPSHKAFFLYSLYIKGKDNSAIAQLENLIDLTKDEDRKQRLVSWLSFCFRHIVHNTVKKYSCGSVQLKVLRLRNLLLQQRLD